MVVVIILAVIAGGSYNRLSGFSAWTRSGRRWRAYQRRADLIPNLVATVQGAANFEKSTLERHEGPGQRGQAAPERAASRTTAAFARFQAAQDQLSGALSRLLVVAEAYPT